jgi:hypothetical protein
LELGTWDVAAEHGELVAQDEDLQVLGGVAAGEQGEQLDGTAQREVGESRQDKGSSEWEQKRHRTNPAPRNPSSRLTSRVCVPFT